jgi:UDP-N-acetylmuramate--alanine ligase
LALLYHGGWYTSGMNIYFSGLGGVGVGPLLEIALDAGHSVQGSDLINTLVTHELAARGVPISIGPQDGNFLQERHLAQPIDWFVYTAALPDDHAELLLAKELGIHTAKRDELLARIIEEKNLKLIAISGTHGKTTTTGMTVWTMLQLGIPISYSVGTTLPFGPSGKFDSTSEYFIYECDEYDRNFLHFSPNVAVITSVDYDHPDTYPTETEYTEAFRQFIAKSQQTILWQQDAAYLEVPSSDDVWVLQPSEVLNVKVAGAHNRRNATLVAKTMEYLGISDQAAILETLARFPGTDRRFEKIADNLYTDYGHHPAEIAATLQLARELSDHVVLVYQPHQNIRQHRIWQDYADQFDLADTIYWLPTYLTREDPMLPIMSFEELTANITKKDSLHFAEMDDQLWTLIQQARQDGKLVLGMGAGTIDKWLRERVA